MEDSRPGSVLGLLGLSVLTTTVGVVLAYRLELALLPGTPSLGRVVLVGLIEEAFVRLVPLFVTFYVWSYVRGHLLSKTEGFLAAVLSGVTVAGLELVVKLRYLARFEAAVRFDALVLPILFVHLPFALLAGRFVYALGERIHGSAPITGPELSRRTFALFVLGYLLLATAHVLYNSTVLGH